jgi:hypothetical protein
LIQERERLVIRDKKEFTFNKFLGGVRKREGNSGVEGWEMNSKFINLALERRKCCLPQRKLSRSTGRWMGGWMDG